MLPFIDTHSVEIAASPETVFDLLERLGPQLGARGPMQIYTRLVGCEDRGAFHIARAERPHLLLLRGAHRFSRYELALRIEAGAATALHADTCAEFPGLGGTAYRTIVISSGAHRIAMGQLLVLFKRRAERRQV